METPVPNFFFMGVQFIHLLALSIWVGGILIIQAVVVPSLLSIKPSQQISSSLLVVILQRFHQITLFCTAALVSTGIIKFWSWENLTPWNLIRYIAIALMSAVSLYAFFKISPQLKQFKPDKCSERAQGINAKPYRLYQQSTRLMLISLICGLTALLMA